MKRNAFGDIILQPGDDPVAAFGDEYGLDMSDNLIGFRFVEEDLSFDWCCELEAESGETMAVHNFETEAQLRDWLNIHGIEGID